MLFIDAAGQIINVAAMAKPFDSQAMIDRMRTALAGATATSQPAMPAVQAPAPAAREARDEGVDLVIGSIQDFVRAEAQLVVLGTGDAWLEAELRRLQEEHPSTVRLAARCIELFPSQQIFAALRAELYNPGPVGRLYAESLSQSLALHLLRHRSSSIQLRNVEHVYAMPAAIRRAIDYLEANIGESIGLADLARAAQISPSTLTRQFKRATGLAPHQYLLRRRIEYARMLPQRGTLSVAHVAHATGFADHSHLTRSFRRHLGIAPHDLLPRGKNFQSIGEKIQDKPD